MSRSLAYRVLLRPTLSLSRFKQLQNNSIYCRLSVRPQTTWSCVPSKYQFDYPLKYHTALSYSSASQFSTEVGTVELQSIMDANDVQLIDVREPNELIESGQIPSAINIPLGTLDKALQMSSEDFKNAFGTTKPSVNDKDVIFFCKRGIRSRSAMEIAIKQGYTQVRHYYEGMDGWLKREDE